MYSFKRLFLFFLISIILIILGVIAITHEASGADYRIYTNNGGMSVSEQGISEGHKSYHQLGMDAVFDKPVYILTTGIDGFIRGEAPEEDPEIMCAGGGAHVEVSYKWKHWIDPYLGIRYDHFSRGTAPKYEDTDYGQETEHDLVSARGGVHLAYKWLWVDLGTIIPFYTNTKSGNFGADLGAGVKFGSWDIGYRFKEYRLTDNHLSGTESISFYFSGIELGYTF